MFVRKFLMLSCFVVVAMLSGANVYADEVCTKEDLVKIKSFDARAKIKLEQLTQYGKDACAHKREVESHALTPKKWSKKTLKEGQDMIDEADYIFDFFTSDEYSAMQGVYYRCGMKAPRMIDLDEQDNINCQ